MDDGGVCSTEEVLVAVWNMLLEESPKLGLELNPAKCEWTWLDPKCTKSCLSAFLAVRTSRLS